MPRLKLYDLKLYDFLILKFKLYLSRKSHILTIAIRTLNDRGSCCDKKAALHPDRSNKSTRNNPILDRVFKRVMNFYALNMKPTPLFLFQ